jgi:glycosyltransferase involved in cell wall biosynthesis
MYSASTIQRLYCGKRWTGLRADNSMNRIRVMHIVQNLNYGGMERLIANMVVLADHKRFDVHVLALQYLGRFSEGLQQYATLHVAPRMRRLSLLRPAKLAQVIREIGPDVVHTHSGVWLKAARAARMAGVPRTIHTEHGRRSPDPLSDRLIDAIAATYSDHVVAVSPKLADHLVRRIHIPREKVCFIPNGVDTRASPGNATTLVRELNLAPDTHVIGSVGRLEPIKGYEVAVEAMARLNRNDVALVVAGDGSERSRLEALADHYGVRSRTHWLGWRDNVVDLHAASTFFTMSSHSEGTSVSLLEAMASGLCPVVTNVGGNSAVLGPELQHRLVSPGDPDALAAGWENALDDATLRAADAATARRRVQQHYSIDQMVRAYERLYVEGQTACNQLKPAAVA